MPVVRSCPRGAPTRPLLVPARFSYSSATPTRPLLVPGGCSLPLRGEVRARPLPLRGEVRAPPGHGHYPGCEHPRARALPGVRAPPGTGTTRGANPGYPCVARPPTRPCARARDCPYFEIIATVGTSASAPKPAAPPRASHSFDGSSPFMPRATLATMRGNGSWRSRPRRRSQSPLATARLTTLALKSLVACAVSRYTLPFLHVISTPGLL